MKRVIFIIGLFILIASCHKDKHENGRVCNPTPIQVLPFFESTTRFQCNGNDEYTYILRTEAGVDSLQPNCSENGPIPYLVGDSNVVYIIIARQSFYYSDTFQTSLQKDTCGEMLTYNVNMIQRTNTLHSYEGGVLPIFCEVDSIPSNYQVVVNYNYVPLGQ